MALPQNQIVYSGVADNENVTGTLFQGLKFWISHRCPSRTTYKQMIVDNGGENVALEKQADYLVVDHLRKDHPPGAISYTFIESSLRNGVLANPDQYRVSAPAAAGRQSIAGTSSNKPTRTPFSAEDDQELYKWVEEARRAGVQIRGNEIYKQLAEKNPRHTYQSWRDRYIKYLSVKPPVMASTNGRHSSPSASTSPANNRRSNHEQPPGSTATQSKNMVPSVDQEAVVPPPGHSQTGSRDKHYPFTQEDYDTLFQDAEYISKTMEDDYINGWKGLAAVSSHTPEEWRSFFENKVLPDWQAQQSKNKETEPKESRKRLRLPANMIEDDPLSALEVQSRSSIVAEARKEHINLDEESVDTEKVSSKPRSSYKIFKDQTMSQLLTDRPDLRGRLSEINSEVHMQWKSLSQIERGEFKSLADTERELHEERMKRREEKTQSSQKRSREDTRQIEGLRETPPSKKTRQTSTLVVDISPIRDSSVLLTPQRPIRGFEISTTVPIRSPKPATSTPISKPIAIDTSSDEETGNQEDAGKFLHSSIESPDAEAAKGEYSHHPNQDITSVEPVDPEESQNPAIPLDPISQDRTVSLLLAPRNDTQAVLAAETQALDFAVPEPEGGFSDYDDWHSVPTSPQAQPVTNDHAAPAQSHEHRPARSRSLSDTEDRDEDSASESEDEISALDLEEFQGRWRRAGHDHQTCVNALFATCMSPQLASIALESFAEGKGLPDDVSGIWTKEDDEGAEGGDARELKRLFAKHGENGYYTRLQFLETWREL